MVNLKIGENLKALRAQYGLNQKQVADRVGVATSAISAYESGYRYPSYHVLIKLTGIFHVTSDYLLGLEKTQTADLTGLSEDEIEIVVRMIEALRNK